ncbi:MAG: glycosyltransferase family protein [Planctomycetota bacterium]
MARILYGFSGEGSGHSSRSREMMTHLLESGHEVLGASYDRGYRNLKDDFELIEIEGLSIASVDNQVSVRKTVTENLAKISEGAASVRRMREVFRDFAPDVAITDFEPITAYLAPRYDVPLVTIDNQHRMRYMRYPCPEGLRKEALLTETVIRSLVPQPDVSLVTTFWFGEVKNERTFLFPPILRREVLAKQPRDDGHVLVYFTHGFDAFLGYLNDLPRERFVVYGSGDEGTAGNLEHRAPSRDGFLDALAGAKAVIATAGFTLLTEALHLHKPYLALPMAGQFEQELNALLLDDLGCGKNGRAATPDTVGDFLYRLPEYRAELERRPPDDNGAILGRLDQLLADGCAEAQAFRRARRG